MASAPLDFATVQWARRRTSDLENLLALPATEIGKVAQLLQQIADLKAAEADLTEAQLTVILQNLHTKTLNSLEAVKGGVMVCFSGGGFEMETFLLKPDGRVPNNKYQSKKAL